MKMWIETHTKNERHCSKLGEKLTHLARRKNGSRYPEYKTMLRVKSGDAVFHLEGKRKKAEFVGSSIAAIDGFEEPKRCSVDLKDYAPFPDPIPLHKLFEDRQEALRQYLEKNNKKGDERRVLFYNSILQLQQGTYLSELDSELASILFGSYFSDTEEDNRRHAISAPTGTRLAVIEARIGQDIFRERVKANYGSRCCFPECPVDVAEFLIASHIERWKDAPGKRGNVDNALCLCVQHDRAFERGFFTVDFTVDEKYQVSVNRIKIQGHPWLRQLLYKFHKHRIRTGKVPPSPEALKQHRRRFRP